MNILHLSPYFPDLEENHAGGVCMGKEVETLRKYHNVYVLTFVASDFDRRISKKYLNDPYYQWVTLNKWTKYIHILTEPFLPNYFAARSSFRFAVKMLHTLKSCRIDHIHAEYAAMGQYFWLIRLFFPEVKIQLIEHDVTIQSYERKMKQSYGAKKIYYQWQRQRILHTEKKYCQMADWLFTFNEKDKQLLLKYYGNHNVDAINPYYGIEEEQIQMGEERTFRQGTICFLGQMGREENYEAAIRLIRISKQVKKAIPELEVYIVGNNPPKELEDMQNDYIHVTGFVENVDEFLQNAQIAVFPLTLGAGIKLKVLRSLALGVPVVTSSVGAEGIDEKGEVLILAESDEDNIKEIIELMENEEKCKALSQQSRGYVEQHFGWKKSEEILKRVYRKKD